MNKTEGLKLIDTSATPVMLLASIAESTLCYSWGSAANGGLGTGIKDKQCDMVSGFQREDEDYFTCEP